MFHLHTSPALQPGLDLNPAGAATGLTPPAPLRADDICRGVTRFLMALGYAPLPEFKLGNGRRVDVAGLNRHGFMVAVEIKTSMGDLRADAKWPEYLPYCDAFYFAVTTEFPRQVLDEPAYLPERTGIILADRFDGAIVREAATTPMNAARRRVETLRFARKAARRLILAVEADTAAAVENQAAARCETLTRK